MPKMKTHKAGAKRYKVTGSGKILRRHAGIGHLLSYKKSGRKRKLFGNGEIAASQMDLVYDQMFCNG